MKEEKRRQKARADYLQSQVNDLWRTVPQQGNKKSKQQSKGPKFPLEPQENILYFIEKKCTLARALAARSDPYYSQD